ncbi:hypothetical protein NBRC116493_08340 [Aurantivibrio infirmus]
MTSIRSRYLKHIFLLLGFAALSATNMPAIATEGSLVEDSSRTKTHHQDRSRHPHYAPRVQVAILLDTSNSMDGLINQTREQLWQMVDELSHMKKNNVSPVLEVAIYQYGNSRLSQKVGYVQEVAGFTSELDRVSEALFSLTTDGGDEYCGFAIRTAVKQLHWSTKSSDIRMIFIAGNEPFTQGPINYVDAIVLAKEKDISITTIYAGDYQEGLSTGWQRGALLADGNFMSIDHNHAVAHVDAPQDKRINELNRRLNDTYIPYGAKGQEAAVRQLEQDDRSQQVSSAFAAKRAKAKASAVYKNSQWDLVDAIESGEAELEALDEEALPEAMAVMSAEERVDFVASKKKERKEIKQEIAKLGKERDKYVESVQSDAPAAPTIKDALSKSIREQASKKEYEFSVE